VFFLCPALPQDKGMPTISTRKFLKLLHTAFPALPMWGLFDADPAGVGIYSEYKHGSSRSVSEGLALPNLQWLGLSLSDADRMGVLQRSKLRLTAKDRTRINNLLAGVAQHDPDMKSESHGERGCWGRPSCGLILGRNR
jgi:DNA topoisomerase VI subunit A